MSRRNLSNETPPPVGANLFADFQQFCQSPEFIMAFQNNPLAAQFTQQMTPPRDNVIPDSEYHASIRCTSLGTSRPRFSRY